MVAAKRERTVGDGGGGVTGLDGGGLHEAGAGAEIEVGNGGAQIEGVEKVATGAVEREEGFGLGRGVDGGESGRVGAGGGTGDGEVVGGDVDVVGVAGVGRGGEGGVERVANEDEELADIVEDIVGVAGEEQTVVGGDEGDAVGETVGCSAGEGPHMSTTSSNGARLHDNNNNNHGIYGLHTLKVARIELPIAGRQSAAVEEDDRGDGDGVERGGVGALALHHLVDAHHEDGDAVHGRAGAGVSGDGLAGDVGEREVEADVDAVDAGVGERAGGHDGGGV